MDFPSQLSKMLAHRAQEGALRALEPVKPGVDLYSNDYLGFARSEAISRATRPPARVTQQHGSTGSRLISGNTEAHCQLERDLATYFDAGSALLFNSGYDANLGLLSSVLQREDRIFYDQLCHASIRDGIRLGNARSYGFRHNDLEDLRTKVSNTANHGGQSYLIVESVYSMDGDQAPLEALQELCEKEDMLLIVDEAHATGVIGPNGKGLVSSLGLEKRVFARVHTFGKALGCHGATILGPEELKTFLVNFARSFIYTTALPPSEALKVAQALNLLGSTGEIEKLKRNISFFIQEAQRLDMARHFIESQSQIQSFLLKSLKDADRLEGRIEREGFAVKAIKAPTVPKGQERIRVCLHSYNTYGQIREFLYLLSTFV